MADEEKDATAIVDNAMACLDDRTIKILARRFGEEPTPRLKDIALQFGIQTERVRQIIAKGIRRLRVKGIDLGNEYDVRGKRNG